MSGPDLHAYAEALQRHADGYTNSNTGLGTAGRDKTVAGIGFTLRLVSGFEADARWRGSELGGAIVERHPRAMLREGWDLTIQPRDDEAELPRGVQALLEVAEDLDARGRRDAAGLARAAAQDAARKARSRRDSPNAKRMQETIEAITKQQRRLGLRAELRRALCYERAFGGALIYVGAQDGRKPWEPLDIDAIKTISHLTTFTAGADLEAVAASYYTDPTAERWGRPEIYQIRSLVVPTMYAPVPQPPRIMSPDNPAASGTWYIHESRCLVFPGVWTTRRALIENLGWGDSVFTRVDGVLGEYGQSWSAVVHLLSDWAQGVFQMPGLMQKIAEKNESALVARGTALDMSRSVARSLMIDKEESFHRETVSLAGLGELLQQIAVRVAAAADMPVSLLFGQSPAGLNATGDMDIRSFYDTCAALQDEHETPQVERFHLLQFRAKDGPTGGEVPEQWAVEQRPLWQMTDKERAELEKLVAERDHVYLADGVVSPDEVRQSRFGGARWSAETVIDTEADDGLAEAMREPQPSSPAVPSRPAPFGAPTPAAAGAGAFTPSPVQGPVPTQAVPEAGRTLDPMPRATPER